MPLRNILPSAGQGNDTPVEPLSPTRIQIEGIDIIVYIDDTIVTTVGRVYLDEAGKVASISIAKVREILLTKGLIPKDKNVTVM